MPTRSDLSRQIAEVNGEWKRQSVLGRVGR